MNLHKLHIEYLEEQGWIIECLSPLEMRHEDGSFASGQAAQIVIKSTHLPRIYEIWYHPDIGVTCKYMDYVPDSYEYVWEAYEDGRDRLKPYYDEPRIGDYWVENGHWYGRREKDGFRVLATGDLIECDDSKWEKRESFTKVLTKSPDDIAF